MWRPGTILLLLVNTSVVWRLSVCTNNILPAQLPKWVPLSIIKGGTSANVLVKSLESDWGNKMFKGQLVNNIGAALYKVRPEENMCMLCLWTIAQ